MTYYAGFWILFSPFLLLFGSHAKPSAWACKFSKRTRAGETLEGCLRQFDEVIFRSVDRNLNCHFFEDFLLRPGRRRQRGHDISHMPGDVIQPCRPALSDEKRRSWGQDKTGKRSH